MQYDRAHAVGLQFSRPSGDLGVAEAVERTHRFEDVRFCVEDESIRRGRSAQWPGAELAVLEYFGMARHDLRAGRTVDRQPQAADEVLTEVEPVRT